MKRGFILAGCLLVIAFNIFSLLTYNRPDESVLTAFISLKDFIFRAVTAIGQVAIAIISEALTIDISHPENTTYNFSIGDTYTLDLNVSANRDIDSWWYDLLDLRHDTPINESVFFTPNTTITAVRWSNKLVVYANDSSNNIANSNVTFFVFVPNSAPRIEYIPPELYVCEGGYFSQYFNVTDLDEDIPVSDISPKNPFYISIYLYINLTTKMYQIYSGNLDKGDARGVGESWKLYEETVSMNDNYNATCCVDTKKVNITVIEINHIPSMTNIGVQTVWTQGDNSSFYQQVQVSDTEDGNQDSGNFTFNITISNSTGDEVNLFNITQTGIMNYTANESQIDIYNISVCVTDRGLENPHEDISEECGQDGTNLTACQNFSLTITVENQAPTITDYYPINLSLEVSGTDSLYFNITGYDPEGTPLDTYWYVDDVIEKSPSGIGGRFDEFTYTFGCGVSGSHNIIAEITDRLLNDSIEWDLSVSHVACPAVIPPSPPGGGGKVGPVCSPKWACDDWQTCQNAEKVLELGNLSGEDYRDIKETCLEKNWDEYYCGFQIRDCFDIYYCNRTAKKPEEIQACFYLEKPSCNDSIKNCHDGDCELLVDCGGPCPPCPTCSDGIQNQDEEGIDCGGPCPVCPVEKPLLTRPVVFIPLLLILLLILLIIIELIREIRKNIKERRRKIKEVRGKAKELRKNIKERRRKTRKLRKKIKK